MTGSLFVALMVCACCGASSVRIIGGTSATAGMFPWQVAVVGGGLCGGSILASNYVLTAGHCVRDLLNNNANENPAVIQVTPGIDRRVTSSSRGVARYWVHPSYSTRTTERNRIDLAILQLTSDLTLNSNVAPVPLCQTGECGLRGSALLVSGYGEAVSDVASSVSTTLKWASLSAIDPVDCVAKWNSNFACISCLPSTNVCAQSNPTTANPNKDSCFGDSGGPLVQTVGGVKKLWGVVSSGTVPGDQQPSCGKQGEYGVYVSIPPNSAWILSVMRGELNSSAIVSRSSAGRLLPLLSLLVAALCLAAL